MHNRYVLLLSAALFLLPRTVCRAESKKSSSETHAACSPIAPDNRGTISIHCNGLSERQITVLSKLLNQLSTDQKNDQNVLIAKLDELLDAVRKIKTDADPRTIYDEQSDQIRGAAWNTCQDTPVQMLVPFGDNEAQHFAEQIKSIYRSVGRSVSITPVLKEPEASDDAGHRPDLLFYWEYYNECDMDYVASILGRTFKVEWKDFPPPPYLSKKGKVDFHFNDRSPLVIVVYPKSA